MTPNPAINEMDSFLTKSVMRQGGTSDARGKRLGPEVFTSVYVANVEI